MSPVPRRVELIGLGDKSQASGVASLHLLGVAQACYHQVVIWSLALQPTLQAVGWAASHSASALLSEV